METKRQGREDRGRVAARFAGKSLVDMFEAALGGDPVAWKQSQLGGTVHQRFQGTKAVVGGYLPDRVHSAVDVERGETRCAAAELGESFADLVPHWPELLASHSPTPVEPTVARKG